MEKERPKVIVPTEFEPTRLIVPELREPPTSMTLYPHVSLEDNDHSCVGELPEPKLFQVDEIDFDIVK